MDPNSLLLFVGIIVGSVIAGGAIHSGLSKIAKAIEKS